MTKQWKKKVKNSKSIFNTPLFPGLYPALAEYEGEDYYGSSDWSPEEYPDFSQLEIRYKTEWEGEDVTVDVFNPLIIQAKLLDYNKQPLSNVDVSYIWGIKVSTKTDNNGYVTLEYTPQRVETQSIIFKYSGTKKLAPSWKTINVKSNKLTPTLIGTNISVYPGESFKLSCGIFNKTLPLKDKELSFNLNFEDAICKATSNAQGYAISSEDYMILTSGNYNVDVLYTPSKTTINGVSDNDLFNSTSTSFNINIKNQIKCKLKINASNADYGTNNTISVTLTETNGTPIPHEVITLEIDGQNITVPATDTNGVTSTNYLCNKAGSIDIYASFSTPKYALVQTSTKMEVSRLPVNIHTSSTSPKYGQICTVTATLTEQETGNPISNQTLYLRDAEGKTYKQSKTDANGQCTMTYTPTHVGSLDYYIYFNQTNKYQTKTTPVTINVQKLNTKLTGQTQYTLYVGTSINITCKLTDENNNELDSQKISIQYDNNTTNKTTTNNGTISWTHKASTSGTSTYTLTFSGTSYYSPTTLNITIISEKRPTSLEFYQKVPGEGWDKRSDTTIVANAFLEIGMLAQLTDLSQSNTNGQDLPIENIPIKIEWKNTTSGKTSSKTVTLNTDANGLVSQLVQGDLADTHNLRFIFEGNEYYLPSSTANMELAFQRTKAWMYRNNVSVFKKDVDIPLDVKVIYLNIEGKEIGIPDVFLKFAHGEYASVDYNQIPTSGSHIWGTATTNNYGVASTTHKWLSSDNEYLWSESMGITTKYPFNDINTGEHRHFFNTSIWYTLTKNSSFIGSGNNLGYYHYKPDYTYAKQFNDNVISNLSPSVVDDNLLVPYGVIVCSRMIQLTGNSTCKTIFRIQSKNTSEYGVIFGLSTSIGRWNYSSDTPLKIEYLESEGVLKINGSAKNVELELNKDYTLTVTMKNNKITKCEIAGTTYNLNINVASYFSTPVGLKMFAFCSHGTDNDTGIIVKEFSSNIS